jgi:hypothetical protein
MTPQTKETIELLDAVFGLADASQRSLEDDGKITIGDAGNFFGPALKLPAAIGGIQKVPSELAGLDGNGRQEVLDYFAKRFELPDDELEAHIESALQTGYQFAVSVIALARYRKAS